LPAALFADLLDRNELPAPKRAPPIPIAAIVPIAKATS
jgi:hypothetical protein